MTAPTMAFLIYKEFLEMFLESSMATFIAGNKNIQNCLHTDIQALIVALF